MLKRISILALGLTLALAIPPGAEEAQVRAWSVYVDGVRHPVNAITVNGMNWFDAGQMVAALGQSLQPVPGGGWVVNGQPLQNPVIVLAGLPYTTPEAMAKTISATVSQDPVRTSVMFQLAANNPGGIPYYSKDYVTAAEEHKRQRQQDLSMAPGDVMLEEWDEKMAEEWRVKHPWMPYVPRAADYSQIQFDSKEMPRVMTDEELRAGVTYKGEKPSVQPSGYLARSANNGVFQLNLTDAKLAEALRGMQPPLLPQPGNKFLVLHLTLENVSKKEQMPGGFNVRDQNGTAWPANTIYSKFSQARMRSRETTNGYLIFEIPVSAQPTALELMVSPALSLSLIYR